MTGEATTRDDAAPRVPHLILERYRLGELPRAEVEALERRLRDDAGLRAQLQALERSDAEIRRRYPPAWLAQRVRLRLAAPASKGPHPWPAFVRRWAVPLAAAAAATVLLVLAPRLVGPPWGTPAVRPPFVADSGDRIKGLQPALRIFRKTADGSETLADGDRVEAGDLVRVGYRAAGRGFGVIVSIDGRGSVTVHLPVHGDRAAALAGGDTVLLDHAYQLDDAPRFERFHFVTAQTPFAAATVVDAARRAATTAGASELPLAASFEQASFLLRKGD
jgi:hypothetical protein